MNLRTIRKLFARSPNTHRPVVCWYWNDHLGVDPALAQADALLEAGVGGLLIKAGPGLATRDILSEDWFETLNAVARRARKSRASIWLSEDLSGPGAVHTMALVHSDPSARLCHLRMQEIVIAEETADALRLEDAVATFMFRGGATGRQVTPQIEASEIVPVLFDLNPGDWVGTRLLVFRVEPSEDHLNVFNSQTTTRLLSRTHEKSAESLKRYWGNTVGLGLVAGAGCDGGAGSLPWDTELLTFFRETRGYGLAPHLPALFYDLPGCEQVRYDFWTLIAEMFREGFASPVQQWFSERKMPCAGHYGTDVPLKAAIADAGSTLPLYGYQDFPSVHTATVEGADVEATLRAIVSLKQAVSVSRQFGTGGVINEGAGATTLDETRRSARFQHALGVGFVTHDAAAYSLRGDRKYDSPLLFSPQQPYWNYTRKYSDAVARTGWLLSEGTPLSRVLVLHPASSMQAAYRRPRNDADAKEPGYLLSADAPFEMVDKHFALISSALLEAQIEFDYGDEEILGSRGGAFEKFLRVGEQAYDVVVIPPTINLRSSTLSLLHDFATGGGDILAVGSTPRLLDGRPSTAIAAFVEEYVECIRNGPDLFDYTELVGALHKRGCGLLSFEQVHEGDPRGMRVQRRAWGEAEIVYVANLREQSFCADVSFQVSVEGHVEAWDAETGTMSELAPCSPDEAVNLRLHWNAFQERFFIALPGAGTGEAAPPERYEEVQRIAPEWTGARCAPNAAPIFHCRIANREKSTESIALEEARKYLATQIRAVGGPVALRTQWTFTISEGIENLEGFDAGMELSADASVALNGLDLPIEERSSSANPAMTLVALPELRHGENTIELWRSYAAADELQPTWVFGDFALEAKEEGEASIVPAPDGIGLGDWESHGMRHYPGAVTYAATVTGEALAEGERAVLHAPGLHGAAELRVNGETVDHLLWRPYTCDLSAQWASGELTIEVIVAGRIENMVHAERRATPNEHGLASAPFIAIEGPAVPAELE